MARHGENIRKRKDGRWEGRYPIYNAEKEKQVYCSVYGKTYEEVRKKLTIKKNLLKSPSDDKTISGHKAHISKEIIFTEIAQDWLAQVKKKRKHSTYIKYSLVYQKHIKKTFENVLLYEMTDSFVSEKFSDVLSDSVQKSVYCVLNQILKFASTQYSLPITPLKRPVSKMHKKPIKVLSKGEQKQLMAVLYQEMDLFKMAILLVLFTGLRLGELCALKFGGDKPMEPRTIQYQFKKILKEADLADTNFHILRHTFSTNCVEDGMDVKSLSEMLGHSDVQITLNRYVHPSMDTKRKYMDSLSAFYGQIYGQIG